MQIFRQERTRRKRGRKSRTSWKSSGLGCSGGLWTGGGVRSVNLSYLVHRGTAVPGWWGDDGLSGGASSGVCGRETDFLQIRRNLRIRRSVVCSTGGLEDLPASRADLWSRIPEPTNSLPSKGPFRPAIVSTIYHRIGQTNPIMWHRGVTLSQIYTRQYGVTQDNSRTVSTSDLQCSALCL